MEAQLQVDMDISIIRRHRSSRFSCNSPKSQRQESTREWDYVLDTWLLTTVNEARERESEGEERKDGESQELHERTTLGYIYTLGEGLQTTCAHKTRKKKKRNGENDNGKTGMSAKKTR